METSFCLRIEMLNRKDYKNSGDPNAIRLQCLWDLCGIPCPDWRLPNVGQFRMPTI